MMRNGKKEKDYNLNQRRNKDDEETSFRRKEGNNNRETERTGKLIYVLYFNREKQRNSTYKH